MKIPTYIISGFLGSGKTEFTKQFIIQNPNANILIIENEVAEFGIDGKVSQDRNVKIIEINDGSISSVNLEIFKKVVKKSVKKIKFDILLIETSGAADLNPIIKALSEIKVLRRGREQKIEIFDIYIITIIDAERFSKAEKLSNFTLKQLENASLVLLNKADLVDNEILEKQLRNIKKLNKNTIESIKCKLNINEILNLIKPKNTEEITEIKNKIDRETDIKKIKIPIIQPFFQYFIWKVKNNLGIKKSKEEKHENINAYVYERYGTIKLEKLKKFFLDAKLPRAKGFIYLADRKLHYFNVVGEHFYLEEAPKQNLHTNNNPNRKEMNRIVLIGENVFYKREKYRRILNKCMNRNANDFLNNLFFLLKNQQKVAERIVHL